MDGAAEIHRSITSAQKDRYGKIQSAVASASHKATPAPPTPYILILKALKRAPLAKVIIPILMKEMLSFTPFKKEGTYGNGHMFKCIYACTELKHRCCLYKDTELMTIITHFT